MPRTTIEKELCEKCGAETRENTQFCYNCGTALASPEREDAETEQHLSQDTLIESDAPSTSNGTAPADETKTPLDELADRLAADKANEEEKLANAAEQRRKARVVRRQPKQYTWEPVTDLSAARVVIFSVLITIATLVVVLITIFWK